MKNKIKLSGRANKLPFTIMSLAAIHNAGYIAARYLLFGNVDTITCAGLFQQDDILDRYLIQDYRQQDQELYFAYRDGVDDDYMSKLCEFCVAGDVAEKVYFNTEKHSSEITKNDLRKIFDYYGYDYAGDDIDECIKGASLVIEGKLILYIELLEFIAEALISAPKHRLDQAAIVAVLSTFLQNDKQALWLLLYPGRKVFLS